MSLGSPIPRRHAVTLVTCWESSVANSLVKGNVAAPIGAASPKKAEGPVAGAGLREYCGLAPPTHPGRFPSTTKPRSLLTMPRAEMPIPGTCLPPSH
jgi:hypothetical protein